MKGPVLQFPVAVRRDHGLLQPVRGQERPQARRPDDLQDLPGPDQDLERPGDQGAQPGDEPAQHEHHGRPPLRLVGHDGRASPRSWRPPIRPGSPRSATDKDVKWPTGTGAAKNSGVAAAVKQTDGAIGYVEQAYALENGFTYAAVKNSSGQLRAADDPEHLGRGQRDHGPAGPRDHARSTRRARGAYPIVSQTFLVAYKDPCKDGGASSSVAQRAEEVPHLRVRPGPADARRGLQPAAVRAAAVRRWRPRTTRSWRR